VQGRDLTIETDQSVYGFDLSHEVIRAQTGAPGINDADGVRRGTLY